MSEIDLDELLFFTGMYAVIDHFHILASEQSVSRERESYKAKMTQSK